MGTNRELRPEQLPYPIRIYTLGPSSLCCTQEYIIQAGHCGLEDYRPHPHKTANYRPIFIFSTVPVSPVKIFANKMTRCTTR